jgi:hypothetical protein
MTEYACSKHVEIFGKERLGTFNVGGTGRNLKIRGHVTTKRNQIMYANYALNAYTDENGKQA